MAIQKGQLEIKTGQDSSDIIYPKTSTDQIEGLSGTLSNYVDLSSNQVIDGQKDFEVVPRIKIEGEQPREGLPNTYTQLQYVESDGSQYIDTTFTINTSTDTVELVFELLGTTLYKWLFGEHDTNARFGLGVGDGTNKRNVAYGTTTYKASDSLFYNQLHYFKADSSGVFIDDTKISDYSSFSSTSTLALFCLNYNGFVNGTSAKIQSYKHTRNNVALIDLVSVSRNSDDKAGFYDFVSESFIGSVTNTDLSPGPELPGPHYEALITDANFAEVAFSGSYNDLSDKPTIPTVNNATLTIQKNGTTVNTFTANANSNVTANIIVPTKTSDLTNDSGFITSSDILTDYVDLSTNQTISGQKDFNTIPRVKVEHTIHNLPDTYQEVEYLESTGNQYINTGVVLTNLHSVEIDYQLTSTQQTNRRGLYGILSTNAASRFGSLFSPTNYQLEHGYGVTNIYWQQGLPDANRHILKQDKNITYMDGIVVHTFNEATFTTSGNAFLGNFNYTNYIPALAKYYESKWWYDGVLIRDFIPCYRVSDDKPGYYDIVNDTFYTNAGTGDFEVGPDVEPITYESLLTDASFSPVATSGNFNDLINKPTAPTYLTSITGYNASKTQVLKNINGVFTWVDESV